eukprot:gene17260-22791_t
MSSSSNQVTLTRPLEPTIDINESKSTRFYDKITIVRDVETARKVLSILEKYPDEIWACDTEVADIDVKSQSPVGNGNVICVSIYGGPDVSFGPGLGNILWIENMNESEGLLNEFKGWFESSNYKKVWHNYGFDRHVMFNAGIDCKGFVGDTMHMARLLDTAREKADGGKGYSLESLSSELNDPELNKISMKDLFGVPKRRKDGTESLIKEIPDVRQLQQDPRTRSDWIEYSSKDAYATWHLFDNLRKNLTLTDWHVEGKKLGNMYDYYSQYLRDFGEVLTDMERNGIMVDTKVHLKEAEKSARAERDQMEKIFLTWAKKYCNDVDYMNPSSSAQIQQLLFGAVDENGQVENTREFKMEKSQEDLDEEQSKAEETNPYINCNVAELKEKLKQRGLKVSGKKIDLVSRLLASDNSTNVYESMDKKSIEDLCLFRGLSINGSKEDLIGRLVDDDSFRSGMMKEQEKTINIAKVKKQRTISITTIGLTPLSRTPKGQPQVSSSILKKLAGQNLFGDEKDSVWGEAYGFFGGGEAGKEACRAIGAVATMSQIDTTISNFLVPLQALVDKEGRIHCSLNLNTETGRLSSRRPNLQNQPALEKDQYKIRDAFIAAPGKTLIVADYGQLELRILAHITKCESMIKAFKQGGCFHSRTAMGMYSYIRESVDNGEVLLEWDYSKGQPNVPLVKDKFGSERRKAKTLNFSIAYGKTVHGLAQDWGITTEEAQKTLDAWYSDRPEVKEWQERTQALARKNGFVHTIMGRYRNLPDAKQTRGPAMGHALRAAINTPIQGSAADIVIMAMIKLWKSQVLKNLGWRLLLQIHDEVILEGPKESRDEAMAEVRSCMEYPYDNHGLKPLLIHLDVDAKSADTWYKAK